jgi:hypothetical protein
MPAKNRIVFTHPDSPMVEMPNAKFGDSLLGTDRRHGQARGSAMTSVPAGA